MAAAVTPCLFEYSITACLKRMVCVILFMANRVTPAFGFCLDNSTLTQVTPIRYLFLCFVTHHCNTYTYRCDRIAEFINDGAVVSELRDVNSCKVQGCPTLPRFTLLLPQMRKTYICARRKPVDAGCLLRFGGR